MGHGFIASHGCIKSGMGHGKWVGGCGFLKSGVGHDGLIYGSWVLILGVFSWVLGLEFAMGFDLLMDFRMGFAFWIQILWVLVM